jgi:hypothetical protein
VKRLVIGGAIAALITGGAGLSFAGAPGPNGHNNFGLCTAYLANGGHGNSHDTKPADALEADADSAGNGDGTASPEEIADYCANQTPGGK